jgi:hypothetical protein
MTVASNSVLASCSTVTLQQPSLSLGSNGGGPVVNWPGSGGGFRTLLLHKSDAAGGLAARDKSTCAGRQPVADRAAVQQQWLRFLPLAIAVKPGFCGSCFPENKAPVIVKNNPAEMGPRLLVSARDCNKLFNQSHENDVVLCQPAMAVLRKRDRICAKQSIVAWEIRCKF